MSTPFPQRLTSDLDLPTFHAFGRSAEEAGDHELKHTENWLARGWKALEIRRIFVFAPLL